MINPLLTAFSLPPFSVIRPEHIVPAVQVILKEYRQSVEKVLTQQEPFTWSNLCQPLAESNDRLARIWSLISHLNAVQNSPKLRIAYKKSLPLLSEFNTWLGQHKELYQAYLKLQIGSHFAELNIAQRTAIKNILRDFKLSGIDLVIEQQKYYGKIVARLSELSSAYSNNILDATMGWTKLITDIQQLHGLPESSLIAAKVMAEAKQQEGWLLTLSVSSYLPILTYVDDVQLRKEVYYAYSTRASDQGPNAGQWDNSAIMEEILTLRHKLARLLGFANYADKSLVTKMAENSQKVLNFLNDLVKHVRPQAKQELIQLQAFAKQYYGIDELAAWDIAYYSEKQKQHLFSINDEELRSYFPVESVLNGLFEVIRRIYGIEAKERYDVDVWHSEVRFFDLFDSHGEISGSFYLDLYVRENKRAGAWMDSCTNKLCLANGKHQKPVAYLTCNFNSSVNDQPALFTHNEVITLFHEFGHGLHHILTKIDVASVSGINGVPWDAVELPSQFMENWCWESQALAFISSHYQTKEPLPKKTLNKLLIVKNYQAALFIIRQLEFSLFDFRIHYEYDTTNGAQILPTLYKVKKQVAVIFSPNWNRFPHTFSHIFDGEYAAGYYSYLWAEVLSADIFSRFKEEGIFNIITSQSFFDNILSRGGSEDPMILFKRFRNREPQLDAMLYHYGIQKNIIPRI
ncbi:oligopeptidase A [Candidatus Fukatsuia anoeciicola]|uniref:oligopeptidase A n=1 Tax=Candidatus Fukatsuia anoeciicola TaxID=2994492 RepID=UPI00346408C7